MIDLKLLKKDIELSFGIPDISSSESNQKICTARAIYYEIARSKNKLRYREIGETIGIESHALVWGGIKKLPMYLKSNPEFEAIYIDISERLGMTKAEYFERKFRETEKDLNRYKSENSLLKEKLQNQTEGKSRRKPKVEFSATESDYFPLIKLLYQVPYYHIETVRIRLEPMIKMLEKPSIHNNLPKE